jgi:uncharacterized membrane protein (DUF441 family)
MSSYSVIGYAVGGLFLWIGGSGVYIWRVAPPPWPLPLVIGPVIAVAFFGGVLMIVDSWRSK